MIDKIPCGYGILQTTALRIPHQLSRRASTAVPAALVASRRGARRSLLLWKSSADFRRGLRRSTIWTPCKPNPIATWMHLHNCRCFQEHLRMLLQSLRALCLAPGGPGHIWRYLQALVRSTGVSGRLVCGFRTDLRCADCGTFLTMILFGHPIKCSLWQLTMFVTKWIW